MEYPIYEGDFRTANPEYATVVDLIPPEPYSWVEDTPPPEYSPFTQRFIEVTPQKIDGVWKRAWQVVDLTPEEIEILNKRRFTNDMARKGFQNGIQMRQLRLQLNSIGKYDTILNSIQTATNSLKIEWEYATEVPRYSELMTYVQTTLQMTDAETDQFYIDASKL